MYSLSYFNRVDELKGNDELISHWNDDVSAIISAHFLSRTFHTSNATLRASIISHWFSAVCSSIAYFSQHDFASTLHQPNRLSEIQILLIFKIGRKLNFCLLLIWFLFLGGMLDCECSSCKLNFQNTPTDFSCLNQIMPLLHTISWNIVKTLSKVLRVDQHNLRSVTGLEVHAFL